MGENIRALCLLTTVALATAGCDFMTKLPTLPSLVSRSESAGHGNRHGPHAHWSAEQWRGWFFGLVERKALPHATSGAMAALRADLNAVGADWQNGWRGDLRPRIYFPVAGCPPPLTADAPGCSYDKAVDVGGDVEGGPWGWVPRF